MSRDGDPWKRGTRAPRADPREVPRQQAHPTRLPMREATAVQDEPAESPFVHRSGDARELRLYGINAVRAAFERRPQALRKLYLTQARVAQLKPVLAWCAHQRVGYRVVEDADLQKLAASSHHEGVVGDFVREAPADFSDWLACVGDGPTCMLWLDGVGNPHNLGAILRAAAHFGAAAVLVPQTSPLALSGAAARVAEGGAEHVPIVPMPETARAMQALRAAGFVLAATVVSGGADVFVDGLPPRVVIVMGAEGEGMDRMLATQCDRQVSIPGTGAVESLNVAAATAVLLAAWRSGSSF